MTEESELLGEAKEIFFSLGWAKKRRTDKEDDDSPIRQGPEWRGFIDGFLRKPRRRMDNTHYNLHYDTWYVIGKARRRMYDNPNEDKTKKKKRKRR